MATIPETGVTVSQVQQALQTSRTDIGALCTHSNINMYSKHKPLNTTYAHQYYFDTMEEYEDELAYLNYGLALENTGYDDSAAYANTMTPFIYNRPDGSARSPYRLGDFRGYNPDATPPFFTYLGVGGATGEPRSYEYNTLLQSLPSHFVAYARYTYEDASGNKKQTIYDGNQEIPITNFEFSGLDFATEGCFCLTYSPAPNAIYEKKATTALGAIDTYGVYSTSFTIDMTSLDADNGSPWPVAETEDRGTYKVSWRKFYPRIRDTQTQHYFPTGEAEPLMIGTYAYNPLSWEYGGTFALHNNTTGDNYGSFAPAANGSVNPSNFFSGQVGAYRDFGTESAPIEAKVRIGSIKIYNSEDFDIQLYIKNLEWTLGDGANGTNTWVSDDIWKEVTVPANGSATVMMMYGDCDFIIHDFHYRLTGAGGSSQEGRASIPVPKLNFVLASEIVMAEKNNYNAYYY